LAGLTTVLGSVFRVAASTRKNIVIARITPGIASCFTMMAERSAWTAVMTPRNG